jgi:hypothetical protein
LAEPVTPATRSTFLGQNKKHHSNRKKRAPLRLRKQMRGMET